LRDIVITEYGIADCKSKTDSETIKSILNITDSRFQDELLQKAKQHGKVPLDYEIPKLFRQNLPEKIFPVIHEMQLKGYCKPFPFGCDLTEDEVVIEKALLSLKYFNNFKMVITIISALLFFGKKEKVAKYLIRMQLNSPKNMKEYVYKKLLTFAIYKQISN